MVYGISASDIPTADLKLLESDLAKRIRRDTEAMEEIQEELRDRASRDDKMTSRDGKIGPHTPQTE